MGMMPTGIQGLFACDVCMHDRGMRDDGSPRELDALPVQDRDRLALPVAVLVIIGTIAFVAELLMRLF